MQSLPSSSSVHSPGFLVVIIPESNLSLAGDKKVTMHITIASSGGIGAFVAASPLLFMQDPLLWPMPLQSLHLMMVPTLETLVLLGFSFGSLLLSFLGLPGIFTYAGALGFGLSEVGHEVIPSTGCRQCS